MTWKLAFVYSPSLLLLLCVYPWGRLSVTSPISRIAHFQFVFRGMDPLSLLLSPVFVDGRSLGWFVKMQVDQF